MLLIDEKADISNLAECYSIKRLVRKYYFCRYSPIDYLR